MILSRSHSASSLGPDPFLLLLGGADLFPVAICTGREERGERREERRRSEFKEESPFATCDDGGWREGGGAGQEQGCQVE